jgi:hypothetical protein
MKQCKCGSYAFNLYKEDIDQGDLCDVHYWKDKALAQPERVWVEGYGENASGYVNSQPEQEPVAVDGNTSDGYHTFNELYDFRKAYNAALFNEWAAGGKCSVHKSWCHHDGELCFGGGWFIVVAVLPDGQISNHYEAKDWDLFAVPEAERALFEFDGHTGADVIHRLKAYTTPPQRTWVGLTDDDIKEADWHLSADREYEQWTLQEQLVVCGVKDFARAIEAKLKEKNT